MQIDLFIFQGAPEPFDEDVVKEAAFSPIAIGGGRYPASIARCADRLVAENKVKREGCQGTLLQVIDRS